MGKSLERRFEEYGEVIGAALAHADRRMPVLRKNWIHCSICLLKHNRWTLWHDRTMLTVLGILTHLIGETLRWIRLAFRSTQSIKAENLFLPRQLALYVERGVNPPRIDPLTRISLAMLSRFFEWRSALVVLRPETMMRWHRAGWRLFWRLKSRPGRPAIPQQLQALIRRMASENPSWGEERIANELLLKLQIQVSRRTVGKYLPHRPPGRARGDLRWSTFLRLHAHGIIACDFLVVVTATFRLLYVFVVIEHHRRRLVHYNVTDNPSSAWTLHDTNTCYTIAIVSSPSTSTNRWKGSESP